MPKDTKAVPGGTENTENIEDIESIEDIGNTESAENAENADEPIRDIDTVTLCDEDGAEYEFQLLGYVDYEDKLYAVMIPAELYGLEEDEQVVIMETYFEGDEPNFLFVEDEVLAQKILDEYARREEEAEDTEP